MAYQNPKPRFVPHKTLLEGWTYISVPDDDIVIGVRTAVTKVMKMFDDQDRALKDAEGNPVYSFQSTNVTRVLTKTEYDVVRKMSSGE